MVKTVHTGVFWKWRFLYSAVAGGVLAWGLMLLFIPAFRDAPILVPIVVLLMSQLVGGLVPGMLCDHVRTGQNWRQVIATGFGLMVILAAGNLFILSIVNQEIIYKELPVPILGLLATPLAYFCTWVMNTLWHWWDLRRRKSLLIAMTHTHMLVAVFISGLFFLAGAGWLCYGIWDDQARWSQLANPSYSLFTAMILWLLMLILLSAGVLIVGAIILFPPSFVLSTVLARRITNRIESLSMAAGALERGDLSATTPVEGEDEIANLQQSLNTMAASIKSYAASLQDEKEKVAALLEAQRSLTANVSHELRTPIATINGYLDSILSHWNEQKPETLQHDLLIIANEAEQLRYLIDDLFALNVARMRQFSFHLGSVDPGSAVRQVVDVIGPSVWHTARVEVLADLSGPLPPVKADEQRLLQILKNLAINGVRHTPPGGFVCIMAYEESEEICFEVTDSGEGIAPDVLPNIWTPYYGDKSQSNQGAGLGLALVKEFTEAMDGSVSVQSEVGRGTSFFIRLPRA